MVTVDTDVAPAIRGTAAHMEHKFAGARVAAELQDRDSPRTLESRGILNGASEVSLPSGVRGSLPRLVTSCSGEDFLHL